jgi:hypothetical protein
MLCNDFITKSGEVKIKQSARGLEFHAFSPGLNRVIHVGTLRGQVYEKATAILRKPEPSISMTQAEYGAALDAGAVYLRCIPSGDDVTYAISLEDFRRHAESYYNPSYGPQWRCPLRYFETTARKGKRSLITDNPKAGGAAGEFVKPQAQQLPMFTPDPRPQFIESGDFLGG